MTAAAGVSREWVRPPRPGAEFPAPWHLSYDGTEPYCNRPDVRAHFGFLPVVWPPVGTWEHWTPRAGLRRVPRAPDHRWRCPFCDRQWRRDREWGLV